jgi:shikimate dehydrogenase
MGWPISHSLSPALHGYWLREHRINGKYLALAVPPHELKTAVRELLLRGYRGVNITVPHKERALQFCDVLDEPAQRIGAVNMVTVTESGNLVGRNTDGIGFLENLRSGSEWRPSDGTAVVLGAGGAARAVVASLIEAEVSEILICNRTYSRSESLASAFGAKCMPTRWNDRGAVLDNADLLVNTTSLGMTGQPPLDLDLSDLPSGAVVNDVVYAPLETPLLAAAHARGNPIVDGLGMLLYQARPAFKAWFGVMPEVSDGLRRFIQKKMGQ